MKLSTTTRCWCGRKLTASRICFPAIPIIGWRNIYSEKPANTLPGNLGRGTGTYSVTSPEDFELPVQDLLTLTAGDYWLIAFATVPSPLGTTAATGYISMPFTIGQDLTVTAIGVDRDGEDFSVYLLANPVPEPSITFLLGSTALFAGRRRRIANS